MLYPPRALRQLAPIITLPVPRGHLAMPSRGRRSFQPNVLKSGSSVSDTTQAQWGIKSCRCPSMDLW